MPYRKTEDNIIFEQFVADNKNLMKVVDKTTRKWYYSNSTLMKTSGIDIEDVKQMVNLAIIKTVRKFHSKPEFVMGKLVTNIVKLTLHDLHRNMKQRHTIWVMDEEESPKQPEKPLSEDRREVMYKFLELDVNDWEQSTQGVVADEVWKIALIVLSDKELEILKKYVTEDLTLEDIGKELNVSKQFVHRIFHESIKKIRTFIKIYGIFWKRDK